jgi:P-type Cu+ transporter
MTVLNEMKLPLEGMTCDGCASHVSKALQNLTGVIHVSVDLVKKQASIRYDGSKVDLIEFKQAVLDAGYTVPTRTAVLKVDGMSCMSCIGHIHGALTDLEGVLDSAVDLSKERVEVSYVAGLVSVAEMEQAVTKAGYNAAAVEEQPSEKQSAGEEKAFKAGWIGKVIRRAGQ